MSTTQRFQRAHATIGPNSLFIRVLVDKKYALPYKVVDALVFHFIRLSNTYKAKKGESEKLPVLWHQSLLVFAQRCVYDLSYMACLSCSALKSNYKWDLQGCQVSPVASFSLTRF